MTKILSLKMLPVLMLFVLMASCGDDDTAPDAPIVNITIDGVEQNYTLGIANLAHESFVGTLLGSSLGIRFDNGADVLTPVYTMEDPTQSSPCMDVGTYVSEGFGQGDPLGFEMILGTINGEVVFYKDSQSSDFSATITSCDGTDDKVSGTFDFLVEELLTADPQTYRIVGSFSDIPFVETE